MSLLIPKFKKSFQKELSITKKCNTSSPVGSKDVLKVQEWLSIWGNNNPAWGTVTAIDGDFGSSTAEAVKNFQRKKSLPVTGEISTADFEVLCSPLSKAFESKIFTANATINQIVIGYGLAHLNQGARELIIKKDSNRGPWVRSYMDGSEGSNMYWCAGFVCTIMDMAYTHMGKDFSKFIKNTWSCDELVKFAKTNNTYIPNKDIITNKNNIQPGDIFLLKKVGKNDWFHTGIILEVRQDNITTLEGNTNDDGSHNGWGVLKRQRNYVNNLIDAIRIKI